MLEEESDRAACDFFFFFLIERERRKDRQPERDRERAFHHALIMAMRNCTSGFIDIKINVYRSMVHPLAMRTLT